MKSQLFVLNPNFGIVETPFYDFSPCLMVKIESLSIFLMFGLHL